MQHQFVVAIATHEVGGEVELGMLKVMEVVVPVSAVTYVVVSAYANSLGK